MRYLHTMVRVRDLAASLAFYCDGLGLKVIRKVDHDKGRFTLVFLAAPEDEARALSDKAPMLELTFNWDPERLRLGSQFWPPGVSRRRYLRDLRTLAGIGRHDQSTAARRAYGVRALAGSRFRRTSATWRCVAADGALGFDGELWNVVSAASPRPRDVAIVGGGPAGLFAAEVIASSGHRVTVYERMPSVARKFLLAGRGGLNLTHSEPQAAFLNRYGADARQIRAAVDAFPPSALIEWVNGLGVETFVGTSGRIFPRAMKASPLLRAWLRRLSTLGVTIHTRHQWTGFSEERALTFRTPAGENRIAPDAVLFALGGASWPKLGSDGGWSALFSDAGIDVTPFRPANSGVRIPWSETFMARFAGAPLKRIALTVGGVSVRGEAVVTASGLEGGAVYALGPHIRAALKNDEATLAVDLKPDLTADALATRLRKARAGDTMSNVLRKAAALDQAAAALLREAPLPSDPMALAERIKSVPLKVEGLAGLEKAISTAGGIAWTDVSADLMLIRHPGIFVAGEMLDWEAPTGGYLLQGTFATAALAAKGLLKWLDAGA